MTIKNYIINSIIILALSCPSTQSEPENPSLNVNWKTPTNLVDTPNSELLLIENKTLVFSGQAELLTAISIDDGSPIWQTDLYDGRALRSDHLLYSKEKNKIIGRHFNNIMVWNSTNGVNVFELSDSLNGISSSRVNFNTLTNNGFAIVGEYNDAHIMDWDGELRYSIRIPWSTFSVDYFESKLFIGQRNTVNGGLTQGRIRAFNAAMGDSLWTYQTDNGGFYEKIYVEDGVVYGGTRGNSPNSEVVALDAKTGAVVWQYITDNPLEYTDYFLVTDEYVFTRGTGYAFALDKQTGERLWGFGWGSTTSVNLVYLEGYLYLSNRGAVYVLDAETGELLHTEPSPPGDGYIYKLGVSENKLFVQTGASIIAYEPWHLRD